MTRCEVCRMPRHFPYVVFFGRDSLGGRLGDSSLLLFGLARLGGGWGMKVNMSLGFGFVHLLCCAACQRFQVFYKDTTRCRPKASSRTCSWLFGRLMCSLVYVRNVFARIPQHARIQIRHLPTRQLGHASRQVVHVVAGFLYLGKQCIAQRCHRWVAKVVILCPRPCIF